MPRRYYRRRYYGPRAKYSNETASFVIITPPVEQITTFPKEDNDQVDPPIHWTGKTVVPATTIYGTRKVKNFDIQMTSKGLDCAVIGVLVYVPEGTRATDLNLAADEVGKLYEPNQNVICRFVIPPSPEDSNAVITRVKTRLARNLDSGDAIVLVLATTDAESGGAAISGFVNYSIKY